MKIYSLCTLAVLSAAIMASCEDKSETPATPVLAPPAMATPIAKDTATTPTAPAAANEEVTIVGSWVRPINGQPGEEGISFNQDGTAASINMATLVYKSWTKEGDNLKLEFESIGNGVTTTGTATYKIDEISPDTLKLSENGNVIYELKKK